MKKEKKKKKGLLFFFFKKNKYQFSSFSPIFILFFIDFYGCVISKRDEEMIFHLISFLFYFTTSEVSDVPHRKSSSQIATKTPSVVTVSPATRRDREGGRRQKTIPGLSKTLFATFHTAAVPPLRLLCFFFLSNYSIMSSSTILQSYTPVSGETLFPLLPR